MYRVEVSRLFEHTRKLVVNERGDVLMGHGPETNVGDRDLHGYDPDCDCGRCMAATKHYIANGTFWSQFPRVTQPSTPSTPAPPVAEPQPVPVQIVTPEPRNWWLWGMVISGSLLAGILLLAALWPVIK
jgi:hypothetical protein